MRQNLIPVLTGQNVDLTPLEPGVTADPGEPSDEQKARQFHSLTSFGGV